MMESTILLRRGNTGSPCQSKWKEIIKKGTEFPALILTSTDMLHQTLPDTISLLKDRCVFRACQAVKTVVLDRGPNVSGTLGFSIVGGCETISTCHSIYLKSIVPNSPAGKEGHLR